MRHVRCEAAAKSPVTSYHTAPWNWAQYRWACRFSLLHKRLFPVICNWLPCWRRCWFWYSRHTSHHNHNIILTLALAGGGGGCHPLRFFCDAPRTMGRIVLKFLTPPPYPLAFCSRSGQSQGQGQVSDLGWPYDKFVCCLCLYEFLEVLNSYLLFIWDTVASLLRQCFITTLHYYGKWRHGTHQSQSCVLPACVRVPGGAVSWCAWARPSRTCGPAWSYRCVRFQARIQTETNKKNQTETHTIFFICRGHTSGSDVTRPQGSVLGPLLALRYLDGLSRRINNDILFFADDTSMLHIRQQTLTQYNDHFNMT